MCIVTVHTNVYQHNTHFYTFFLMWCTFCEIQLTFWDSEWKSESISGSDHCVCLALQQLAGHRASHRLAAYIWSLGYQVAKKCFKLWKDHNNNNKLFHFNRKSTITLLFLCRCKQFCKQLFFRFQRLLHACFFFSQQHTVSYSCFVHSHTHSTLGCACSLPQSITINLWAAHLT